MKKMKSILAVGLIGIMLSTTGCFGSFGLTKKVYNFNAGVGGEPVQTIVMWAMFIIPVYEVAGVLDLFILNTLEYWTGSNPIASIEDQEFKLANGQMVSLEKSGDKFLVKSADGVSELHFDASKQVWALEKNGELLQTYELLKDGTLIKHTSEKSEALN